MNGGRNWKTPKVKDFQIRKWLDPFHDKKTDIETNMKLPGILSKPEFNMFWKDCLL